MKFLSRMDDDRVYQKAAIIRSGEESDLDSLCDLYFEFHEFHAQYLPAYLQSLGEPTVHERMELRQAIMDILQGSESAILVAEESGRIVGFAEIYLKLPDPNDRAKTHTPYAHLQSLYVAEAFRHKRIGKQLLQAVEDWARMRGAVELTLDIWEFSAGPLEFYRKSGYHTYRRALTKNL